MPSITAVLASLIVTLAASVSTDRIGQAFNFNNGIRGKTLNTADLAMNATPSNLTAKSGAVIYSAMDGFVERFGSLAAPDSLADLHALDKDSIRFGNLADRAAYTSAVDRIVLNTNEWNGAMNDVAAKMEQVVHSKSVGDAYVAKYSTATRFWCHPHAAPLPTRDWMPSVGDISAWTNVWGGVDEIRADDDNSRYCLAHLNRVLVWAYDRNHAVRPFDETTQSSVSSGFAYGTYAAYMQSLFGFAPSFVAVSASLRRDDFRAGSRLALPLFAKTVTPLAAVPIVAHEYKRYTRRRSKTGIVRNFALVYGDERLPSFASAQTETAATNIIEEVTNTIDTAVLLANSNASTAPMNVGAWTADLAFSVPADERVYVFTGNGAIIRPADYDPDTGEVDVRDVNYMQSGEGYTYTATGQTVLLPCTLAWTNTVATIDADVTRSAEIAIPAAVITNAVETFPSVAARTAGRPSIKAQFFALKNKLKRVAGALDSDPTYSGAFKNAGTFIVNGHDWDTYATNAIKCGSVAASRADLATITGAAYDALDAMRLGLISEHAGDGRGMEIETLLPMTGMPEETAYAASVAALSGARVAPTGQALAVTEILYTRNGELLSPVAAHYTDDTWRAVSSPIIVGRDGAFVANQWSGPAPTFGYTDEIWWRACIFTDWSVWCDWTWGNYNLDD